MKTPQVVLPWEAPMEKELREAAREGKLMEVSRLLESKAWAGMKEGFSRKSLESSAFLFLPTKQTATLCT